MLALLDGYEDRVIWLKKGHLSKLWYLYQLFLQHKNGIIISYLATTNLINGIIGRLAGTHIRIGGIRNSKLKPYKHNIQKVAHNHLLTCSIFNNKQGLKDLVAKGFNETKSVVIHNGIEVKQAEKKTAKSDSITILTVGRFVSQKDYNTAIKAFQKAAQPSKAQKYIRYIIVGHGPMEDELRKFVETCNMIDQVEFVINPPDVDSYYKKADIYLSTSLFEGLSNSIMEAMSFSLPVVATDVGDNNQLVIHCETGFLEKTKDVDAIAVRIATLIEDTDLRQSLGIKAYQHISDNFSLDTFSQKYLSLIERFTNEKKA